MIFGVVVLAVITIKSFNESWFEPQTPLALNNQPALVFFTLGRGCECQMRIIRNAEAQLAAWSVALEERIPILRVDFSRRPDLVRQLRKMIISIIVPSIFLHKATTRFQFSAGQPARRRI
jgi:hypothetical protein